MKILRIYLKKKSEKDYLNSLQSCVYVRPLYGVVHLVKVGKSRRTSICHSFFEVTCKTTLETRIARLKQDQ